MAVPALPGVLSSGRSPYGPVDQANFVAQGTILAVGPGKAFSGWGPLNLSAWSSYVTSLDTDAGTLTATVGAGGAIAAGASINSSNVPAGTTVGAIAGTSVTLALPTYTYYGSIVNGLPNIYGLRNTDYLLGSTVAGYGIPAATTVSSIVTPAVPSMGIKGVVGLSANTTLTPQNNQPLPYEFSMAANIVPDLTVATASFTSAAIGLTASFQVERSFDGGASWIVCNSGGAGFLAQFTAGTPVSTSFGDPERQVLYRINCTSYTGTAGITLNYRISTTGQAATSLSVPTI